MPDLVLSREQSREVDQIAVQEYGFPSIVLMENAGRGTAELLLTLGIQGKVIVCAGKGNNGGDGFVIARHLENHGMDVRVLLCTDPEELRGDAAINYQVLRKAGTPVRVMTEPIDSACVDGELADAEWIVDALLGTGAQGTVREPYRTMIDVINRSAAKKLAVDVPSGLDCDLGVPMGCCIRADHTATFVAWKKGFVAPGASEWTGCVHVIEIGIPRSLVRRLHAQQLDES